MSKVRSDPFKKLFLEAYEEETRLYERGAQAFKNLGVNASARGMKGWLHVYENLLPLLNGDVDRWEDFVKAFKLEMPEGKTFLKETLETAADETPENILSQGLKVSNKIKDAYSTMYHYANESTLLGHADEIDQATGLWKLHSRLGGRYITPENLVTQGSAKSRLQLPYKEISAGVEDVTTGRFKCVIVTEEIASDCRIPRSKIHSGTQGNGDKEWLEAVAKDNPLRGDGGAVQFTQEIEVQVEVYDLKVIDPATGQPTKVLNKAHLQQLIQQHP